MEIREIRKLSGLTQKQFAEKYDIPLITLQQWEANPEKATHRTCTVYLKKLLEKAVRIDFDVPEER